MVLPLIVIVSARASPNVTFPFKEASPVKVSLPVKLDVPVTAKLVLIVAFPPTTKFEFTDASTLALKVVPTKILLTDVSRVVALVANILVLLSLVVILLDIVVIEESSVFKRVP